MNMYIPERKTKDLKVRERKSLDLESRKLPSNITKEEKEEIMDKYIRSGSLQNALKNISLSQINRFYSILEERKFSFGSGSIKEFVDEQIDRGIGQNENEITFYQFFRDNFLTAEYENDQRKNKILMELVKKYIRYYVGQKRLAEMEKEN